uniref:PNPLA domain-containing protein n=1 Tax=Parastrongyloides trichosuri TaxID=131310 RepID=A0A0N4ZDU8_PARTI
MLSTNRLSSSDSNISYGSSSSGSRRGRSVSRSSDITDLEFMTSKERLFDFIQRNKEQEYGTHIEPLCPRIKRIQTGLQSRSQTPPSDVEEDELSNLERLAKKGSKKKFFEFFRKEPSEAKYEYAQHNKAASNLDTVFKDMEHNQVLLSIHNKNVTALIYAYILDKFDKDYRDSKGNNYLHWGVRTEDEYVVKTLLLFVENSIALLEEPNNKGKTPLDYIEPNSAIFELLNRYSGKIYESDEIDAEKKFQNEMIDKLTEERLEMITKESKILVSLDGGGIRGLCTLQMLRTLDDIMGPEYNFWDNVDWTYGTSTGGIISCLLSTKNCFHNAIKAYLSIKNKVFADAKISYLSLGTYKSNTVETLLKECYGENTSMSELDNRKKVAVTSAYKKGNNDLKLYLFRNFELESDKNEKTKFDGKDLGYMDPKEEKVWRAVRCTSAAPYYFESFGKFADGALFCNNPSLELMTDYFRYNHVEDVNTNGRLTINPADDIACLISFGTSEAATTSTDIDSTLHLLYDKKEINILEIVKRMARILFMLLNLQCFI